tara:strand:- start:658 stop:975 length:318 start_codon:yes stop_codon:yes gene_type:complete
MPRRRGRRPSRLKRRRGFGGPPGAGSRSLRARGRKMVMGGGTQVPPLPDLPREARGYKHLVRLGGKDNSGRADLYVCPGPAHSPDCVKLNDHQKKIISNGDPYKG